MTASVSFDNHIFIGIDVSGASFEAAWHRGGSTQYENRPDAIAAFVARLGGEKQIIRIAVEPTGGYEKPLVKALRGAGLPVEMVHTSRFAAYRTLVGQVRYLGCPPVGCLCGRPRGGERPQGRLRRDPAGCLA